MGVSLTAPRPTPRRQYLFGWGVTTLGTGLVFPLTAVYLREHVGLAVSGVSAYFALFAAAGLVVNPVAGGLCDTWRPGRIAILATLFQAAGPFFLLMRVPELSMIAALFSGAGTGIFYAVLTPLLMSVFGKHNLSRMLAAQYRVTAGTVGAGALLGGLLTDSFGVPGYQLCFAVNGVSYLLYGLVLAGVLRHRNTAPSPSEPADGAAAAKDAGRQARSFRNIVAPFTDRLFLWVLLLQGMLVTFGLGQIESVTPIVLRDSVQLAVSGISVVLAVNSVAVIALQGLALKAVERLGHMRALQAAVGCWCVSLLLLGLSAFAPGWQSGLALAAGYAVVFAAGECLISPSLQPVVVEIAPPGKVASYSASTSLIYGTGNLIAPAVCLPVFSTLGFAGYLALQLVGYAIAAGAVHLLRRRSRRAEPAADERTSELVG